MLYRLAAPASNTRGPQYLLAALTALHRVCRGRSDVELLISRDAGQVGLYTRCDQRLSPLMRAQLHAAYPDLRVLQLAEDALDASDGEACAWATLRLVPNTASLIAAEQLLDVQEHQLVDPVAGILAAVASRRGEKVRPIVSLVVRPGGRLLRWRLQRRSWVADKSRGPLWTVEVRLAVVAPPSHVALATAKIQELAAMFEHFLPAGGGHLKLSRIRRGRLPAKRRWPAHWLLTPAELAMLWHIPTHAVRTPELRTNESREFEPPPREQLPTTSQHAQLAVLGRTAFRERRETFGMLPGDRFRHLYLIGQTGTGKSTLLLNLAAADIAAGRSMMLLDPHGDLCEQLLAVVPPSRTNDVIYFDPSEHAPISYNPLDCPRIQQRPLVASAIVTSFRRLFGSSYGPRLEHILRNCVLTLLENDGTTLLSLQRLLSDEGFRKQLVGRLADDVVRSFWLDEWASWKPQFRAEAIAPVLNKVGALVTHPLMRNVLGDRQARLNLREVLDSGKVLLCNLSKGKLGEDAATLLGSLLVAGAQLAAMSRADQPEVERRGAYLFVDEFQNFLTSETMPTLLAEMRKYRLAVTIAHQHLGQLDEATAAAVFGNAGSLIAFRLGQDADVLAEQLGGELLASDLRALPKYHAYVRLLIDGSPCGPFSMTTLPPPQALPGRQGIVRRTSHARYSSTVTPQVLASTLERL